MGKYLQDFMYDISVPDKKQSLTQQQKAVSKSCSLIAELFNLYLPKKVEVGHNIWRFIVHLTLEESLNGKTEEIGQVQESYIYYDYNALMPLQQQERKKILLELFSKGIQLCCSVHNCSLDPFRKIEQKVLADRIVYNDYHKGEKLSPDKKHIAQMKGYLSEDIKQLSVEVFDRSDTVVNSISVGNFDFRAFDRIQWVDNWTLHVYHINNIQSYRSKKVADDYFTIDIRTGTVSYHPVTRESIFDYGVELLTETDEYERALEYIHQAKKLGHGKADNILRNLEINPEQRNKAILLQAPSSR
jgi:hypothetical protein